MSEKKEPDLRKKKEQDLKQRRLRVGIRTQMDNAIYAFMYAVESHDLEVEKAAEDYLIELLFNQEVFEKCEEAIGAGKKTVKDLISSSRKIAETTAKLALADGKDAVSRTYLEKAIKSLRGEYWPFNQDE